MTGALEKLRPVLEAANVAHLATLMPDGRPTSVPVWVGVHGEQLAILTIPDSIKDRNIVRDPRVALSWTAPDNPYLMASARGRVTRRIDSGEAWPIIDSIAHRYTGEPYPERSNRIAFVIDVEVAWSASF